ncbi:MAG: S-methyl-5-thioribose-1-phosphate isomerase [Candidatus Thorarchaeota archaeon]
MKVKINNQIENYQSIWMDKEKNICAIDQRKLPFSFEIFKAKSINETCFAIKDMVVRGAPLIGVTAAYGLLQNAYSFKGTTIIDFKEHQITAGTLLSKTRPTAVDLFNTIEQILKKIDTSLSIKENINLLELEVRKIVQTTIDECLLIGKIGNEIIPEKCKIMTICNAGALATVDYGTALAPIRTAFEKGKDITVYVNETRPRLQGGRLTAWELYNEEIEHYIIADNVAGYLIQQGKVDLVITGADRIALNGDTANKIGTYILSVLCKEHKVPFYIAAPNSTFDRRTKSAKEIIIEERDGMEVRTVLAVGSENDKNPKRKYIHNIGSKNLNPAFDLTPAENITGFITPKGIVHPPFEF